MTWYRPSVLQEPTAIRWVPFEVQPRPPGGYANVLRAWRVTGINTGRTGGMVTALRNPR